MRDGVFGRSYGTELRDGVSERSFGMASERRPSGSLGRKPAGNPPLKTGRKPALRNRPETGRFLDGFSTVSRRFLDGFSTVSMLHPSRFPRPSGFRAAFDSQAMASADFCAVWCIAGFVESIAGQTAARDWSKSGQIPSLCSRRRRPARARAPTPATLLARADTRTHARAHTHTHIKHTRTQTHSRTRTYITAGPR